MSGINKVILVGHLGKDPDFRYLPDSVAVLSFPLATSEYIIKNGVKTEHTEWHNIVMWRSLAETGHKTLRKGKLIYIEGKCRTRSFDDKEGIKRYTTEIIADTFTILGRNSDFETDEFLEKKAARSNE
jgi:single-strand DNA-binding protein